MIIKSIHIESFGALKQRDFKFSDGLNIIEGKNESGKSTVATFIKFMLYGLSGRKTDGTVSDKQKYASWDTGTASGSMVVSVDGKEYKIERDYFSYADMSSSDSKDRCVVTDLSDGSVVYKNEVPGTALLGIPEQLFVNTVFVKQLGDGKIDGTGMTEAIENLLMSGDEGVSTKKAIERLEKERVLLRHKTGTGGLINELQRETQRLKRKLDEVSAESTDIIELESAVEELSKTIEKREKEVKSFSLVSEAFETVKAKRRLDEAKKLEKEIFELDEKLKEFEALGNIPEKVRAIHEESSRLKTIDEKLKALRTREAELEKSLPAPLSEEETAKSRDEVLKAAKIKTKRAKNIVWGIILLLLSGGIVAADLLINPDYHSVFLSTAAVLLGLGFFLLFTGIKNSADYKKILAKWNVSTVAALERAVNKAIESTKWRENPESDYGITVSERKFSEAERISTITELSTLAEEFTYEDVNIDDMVERALDSAQKKLDEINSVYNRRNEAYGKYSILSDVFGDDDGAGIDKKYAAIIYTDAGRLAGSISAEEFDTALKKARFAENALPSLRTKLSEKENRLSVLRATVAEPAAVFAELEAVEEQLKKASNRYKGIALAIESLTKAGDALRHSLMPRVKIEAERIMGHFTDGKYTSLGVDRKFDITFEANGKTREEAFFSAGTKDVAYICLRIALSHILFSYNSPPVIYDESFARVDAERLRKIILFLNSAGENENQSILFTCRKLEGEIAQRECSASVIKIDR